MRDFASAHGDYLDPDRHLEQGDALEESEGEELPAFPCEECGAELAYDDPESDIGKPGRWYCPVCEEELPSSTEEEL